MFTGSLVAIVTPFRNGEVDLPALKALTEWQIAQGTSGIVPCGTTGEAATLTTEERRNVIVAVIDVCRKRVPVIPGTGSNATRTTIEQTKMAKDLGADGVLIVTPYYNKPPQEGLFRHFEAVARAVETPIVLYNVPGRTSVNMTAETTARLSKVRNIVAVKEASGDINQIRKIRELCEITILSGDDGMTWPIMEAGGKGVISVAANVIPDRMARMVSSPAEARKAHEDLADLFKTLFIETNPIPVKTALALMGRVAGEFRLPLCELSPEKTETLKAMLRKHRLIPV